MTRYEQIKAELRQAPKTWLVTGVAGFIGSNLLETLLKLDQRVVGLDNFATGHQRNLDEVQTLVTPTQWANFHFIEGDIRQLADCQAAMTWQTPVPLSHVGAHPCGRFPNNDPTPVNYVLHQAALGSVPRSLADPIATNETNITGFLNMLVAARDAKVQSFTYAASSSTYGDHPALPKVEENIGKPLSPYAVTKYVNELYADVFARSYGFNTIGLRYFNVFGPRQDPNGAYAAVIPKWTDALIKGEPIYINGDGETSRDFCFVANAVQANLLAATAASRVIASEARQSSAPAPSPFNQVYNVAVGDRTTLNHLFALLRDNLAKLIITSESSQSIAVSQPVYRDFRAGDVRHSQADVSKAKRLLGYAPSHKIGRGIEMALLWYVQKGLIMNIELNKPIYVTQPFLPPLNEFIPYLEKIWDKKVLTNGGPFHQALEKELCDYLGVKHISLFTNGTIALVTALQALRITGEVITTPYSFVATAHSLLWNGIKPVFVDIDPKTLNMDPAKIEAAITPNTTAIMPVHCYGKPCDVDAIQKIADNYNLKVIYDAAHAFGVKCHCGSVLNHGDLSVLSFHATKVFNTFEGGAIICPDTKTKQRIDHLKNFGFVDEVTVVAPGINGKMSEINAAFGMLQLQHVDTALAKRKSIDAAYRVALRNVPGIRCLPDAGEHVANYSYFPLLVETDYPLSRDALYQKLKDNNIYARRYFYPLITDFPMYRGMPSAQRENLPVATAAAQKIICLPIYPNLAEPDIARVISIVKGN